MISKTYPMLYGDMSKPLPKSSQTAKKATKTTEQVPV